MKEKLHAVVMLWSERLPGSRKIAGFDPVVAPYQTALK